MHLLWFLVSLCAADTLGMPQAIGQAVKKTAYSPAVSGAYDQDPTPEQVERVKDFLTTFPAGTKPESVAIVPSESFAKAVKAMKNATDTKYAFTNLPAKRIYLNAAAFDDKDPDQVEWLLAHEVTHMNDLRPARVQEKNDRQIDASARTALAQWRLGHPVKKAE